MRFDAVLVTRGNVDLGPVIESIHEAGVKQVVVWDNSIRQNMGVYGRYAALDLPGCEGDAVFVQDDDCLVPVEQILDRYEPGRLVANMPAGRWRDYPDSALVGWGALFDRDLWAVALGRFADAYRPAETLEMAGHRPGFVRRTCDVLFSTLTPRTVIDVGFSHREFAEGPDRMFKQPGHKTERDLMLDMCRRIRSEDDDRR